VAGRVARRQAGTVRAAGFKALQADFPPLPSPPIPGTEPGVSEPSRALLTYCPLEGEKTAQVTEKLSDEIVLVVCQTCGAKFTLYCDELTVTKVAGLNDRRPVLAPLGADEGTLADG